MSPTGVFLYQLEGTGEKINDSKGRRTTSLTSILVSALSQPKKTFVLLKYTALIMKSALVRQESIRIKY